MKVLFITRSYPPVKGGMELFAYELSAHMSEGCDLTLVKWAGRSRRQVILWALPYLSIRSFITLLFYRADVIHVQDGVLAPIGYVLSRLFRTKLSIQVHGLDTTYDNFIFKHTVPVAAARADVVFCNSQGTAVTAEASGIPIAKIKVINLAVDDMYKPELKKGTCRQKLSLPKNSPVLLTVGRLVERKGAAWFISNVLPQLVNSYPDLIYVVLGEGNNREHVEAAITKGGMSKHVILAGRASDEDKYLYYTAADIFVMPNLEVPNDIEGFGLVALEASIFKLPVVAAGIQGISDAIDNGKNGFLVNSKAVEEFIKAISGLLNNPKESSKFGSKSRDYTLKKYSWAKVRTSYLAAFENILESS